MDDLLLDKKYDRITKLSNSDVFLVRNKENGLLYVEKVMPVYSADVYNYLKQHHVPNTPRVFEIEQSNDKLIVIEEHIQGLSLTDYLEKKSLSIEESTDLIRQLCVIVKNLHECNPPIIHRDIKPDNIIINDGVIKLVDIDAAKFFDKSSSKDTYLLGTHGYAAPEQYGFGKASVASDIYEIGKTLNAMCTGDPNAKTGGILGDIIDKCTEIDPKNRYQSVDLLLKDLDKMKSSVIDYNTFPGFRKGSRWTKILAGLGYGLFAMVFMTAGFEGETNIRVIWCLRIGYLLTFLAMFLFSRNYRYIWRVVGVSRIENKFLKILIIAMIDVGILFIGLEISVNLGSVIAKIGG